MIRRPTKIVCSAAAILVALLGCSPHSQFISGRAKPLPEDDVLKQTLKQISYEENVSAPCDPSAISPAPFALDTDSATINYWDLTLDEAIQMALANSSVLRDLGAMILQAPNATPTIYDPSIQATDPRFGVESALSAFDADFASRVFYEKNDRALNNALLGGGTNFFLQDLWRIQSELKKHAATGTQFSLRHNIEDDLNNAPANLFGTDGEIDAQAWSWNTEAEIRQPFLQGAGVEFNRIAGPNAVPGLVNGVVIARLNTDISSTDFQLAVRDYLSNVENAYWELVYAYRDLDAKKKARDRSLETWQTLKERQQQGFQDVETDKIAQAAEQYYRFQEDVETALSGRLVDGTRDFSGSTGGTFQGTGGVYVAERRLRLIMGVPINDNRLIRPVTEPVPAKVVLNWEETVSQTLCKRTELVRQRLRVKRRSLELVANRNFLLPRLDAIGRYRRRGLGDSLYNPVVPFDPGNGQLELADGGSDEWQVGVELDVPIGYRQANSSVRNSELALSRERALLGEMERQVVHDLSNAVAEQTRSYQLVETAYNRRVAAERQYRILIQNLEDKKKSDFNLLLDSIRRLAEAESTYDRAKVNYAVSLKNLHVEQGDLMQYCNVHYSDDE